LRDSSCIGATRRNRRRKRGRRKQERGKGSIRDIVKKKVWRRVGKMGIRGTVGMDMGTTMSRMVGTETVIVLDQETKSVENTAIAHRMNAARDRDADIETSLEGGIMEDLGPMRNVQNLADGTETAISATQSLSTHQMMIQSTR
jgi:hypothetical protein